MKPINFPEQNTTIAKDQPQYFPLPAHIVVNDPEGQAVFCWKLSVKERLKLLFTGKIWHHVLTFRQPLQPQLLEISSPFVTK